ncbi:MAG: T9SS type A sorting domain-containing protein [Bacteroidales bacterium]|nr:T9SS type A sorting domain-containing protein [Bacteroidales bacterium]
MKKLYLFLLIQLALLSVLSAQVVTQQQNFNCNPVVKSTNVKIKSEKSNPVWECTFDETTPLYTTGHLLGDADWEVSDTTPNTVTFENGVDFTDDNLPPGTMVTALWLYMGYRDVGEYSLSGGNFASIDGISFLMEENYVDIHAWIQFNSIDLSTLSNPRLILTQNYKAYNFDTCFIDLSVDGGTVWSETLIVNGEAAANQYGEDVLSVDLPISLANQSNVSVRMRWNAPGGSMSYGGYGWEIDDLRIEQIPVYDLNLADARMNFFEYIDYTDPVNSEYFHISSHYGMIPQSQFGSSMSEMVWNAIVENNGVQAMNPDFQVRVSNPEGTELYNNVVTGPLLESGNRDTIDLISPMFVLDNPVLGEYSVDYSINSSEDLNLENNVDSTKFFVTEDTYARDLGNISSSISMGDYLEGGNDGDMLGTSYLFLANETVFAISVFIDEETTVGTGIVGHLMDFSQTISSWTDVSSSSLHVITEDDLGTWVDLALVDPVSVDVSLEDGSITYNAAIEFFYEGDEIRIGTDPTVKNSIWGNYFYFTSEGNWYNVTSVNEALAIRLKLSEIDIPEIELGDDISTCQDSIMLDAGSGFQTYWWNGNEGEQTHMVTESGQYVVVAETAYGSQVTDTIDVQINENPIIFPLMTSPEDGVLQSGDLGSLWILDSEPDTEYWVQNGTDTVFSPVVGIADSLGLGTNYTTGTYEVYAKKMITGCESFLGSFSFVENNGLTSIVARVTYNDPPISFPEGTAEVFLYRDNAGSVELQSATLTAENCMASFTDIEAGTYFLASNLVTSDDYNCSEYVYFEDALIFDDATAIEIAEGEMRLLDLHHIQLAGTIGSNNVSGTVGEQGRNTLNMLEDMLVAMTDGQTGDVLEVQVTNQNGEFEFVDVPNYANLEFFVSNPIFPEWIPAVLNTNSGESYVINFVVDGNQVYPLGKEEITEISNQIQLYPNPSTGFVHISSSMDIVSVIITDIEGRQVAKLEADFDEIDIKGLETGVYFLKIQTSKEIITRKLIKH